MPDLPSAATPHDPYAALRLPEFRAYILARFTLTLALQMQSVVVGWQVYQLTHDKLALGLIGLAEAIPAILVSLVAGHVADATPRKAIVQVATTGFAICTALLLAFVALPGGQALLIRTHAWPIYGVIFLSGISRGFISPALFSFMPQLIGRRELLSNAITWSSTTWQSASVAGPALGGLLLGYAPRWFGLPGLPAAYGADLALTLFSLTILTVFVRARSLPPREAPAVPESLWVSLTSGLRFVFGHQLILGSISLDLFAVLFGGAIALLPVYATDILRVGPEGLGILRAAPSVGSVLMLVILNYLPVRHRAGYKLLGSVAGFGLATIFFGISTSFYLSVALLFLTGAFDAVSVVLRSNLLHLHTPEHIKGRVSAVNSIFIGSSNEIGAFESGVAAKLLGTVPSVVFGGAMTLVVVAVTAWRAKALRQM